MSHHGSVIPAGRMPDEARRRLLCVCADEQLALEGAIWISRFRKKHGKGPTFSELFASFGPGVILDDDWGSELAYSVRHHIAVHWRREGWIRWSHSTRSLSTGTAFQAASAAHRASLTNRIR